MHLLNLEARMSRLPSRARKNELSKISTAIPDLSMPKSPLDDVPRETAKFAGATSGGYFPCEASFFSSPRKLSPSSQNCSVSFHGLSLNSSRAVQGFVYAFGSSMVMSSTR
jgi:hypothetical protein